MSAGVARAAARAAGAGLAGIADVAGGDVNRAMRVTLDDGRSLFVKHRPGAPPGMYGCEAHGLGWLAEAHALRVPAVVAWDDGPEGFLALEWLERGRPARDHDERLGRGLAALHRAAPGAFGLDRDNMIATIPQANGPAATWAEFLGERRILPLVREAVGRGLLGAGTAQAAVRLVSRLPDLSGPPEPPARLHGDLWSGNAITDAAGAPVLVDPAVYGGHREMDLAMMRLFGGFSERVFAAYDEAFPPAAGHADRVGLCQVVPLLVHVLLFGGPYVAPASSMIARYGGSPGAGTGVP